MMIDQYHQGEQGSVFDGRVEQVDLGWDLDTCKAVSEACRVSLLIGDLPADVTQTLRCAVADLDFKSALLSSRDRHPAQGIR